MTVPATRMTVEAYLVWSEVQDGRWELIDGEPVKQKPERIEHLEIKLAACMALQEAVRRSKVPCQVLPSGAAIRISPCTVYEPDALVRCGPRLPGHSLEIPDPVVVVEVVSPSSAARDYGEKVDRYFDVPSLQHYLILVLEPSKIVHCRRGRGGAIEQRWLSSGALRLDPPGLDLEVAELFGAA